MEYAIISIITTLVCLALGFYVGYKIGKQEKLPSITEIPQKIEQKRVEKKLTKEQEEELNKLNTIWQNIETYDGSSRNQKEV